MANAVKLWAQVHNKLPPSSPQKLTKDVCGNCLKSQHFWRALNLCKFIEDNFIASDEDVKKIVNVIFMHDWLSISSEVYNNFPNLLNRRRSLNKSYANYVCQFSALIGTLSAQRMSVSHSESLLGMMVLTDTQISDTPRVMILSPANGNKIVVSDRSNDQVVDQWYKSIARIIHQIDKKSTMTKITCLQYLCPTASHWHLRLHREPNHPAASRSRREATSYSPLLVVFCSLRDAMFHLFSSRFFGR